MSVRLDTSNSSAARIRQNTPPTATPSAEQTPATNSTASTPRAQQPRSVSDGFGGAPRTASPLVAQQAGSTPWVPAPSLDAVRLGEGAVQLQPGMEGDSVRELQRLLNLPSNQQDGRFGDITLNAVKQFQQSRGLTPPAGAEGHVGPTTLESLERSRPSTGSLNLREQLSSPDSLISRAIGYSEGNRTLSGGKTDSYYGHRDPGNGARNQGTFSYQHGAPSSEEADRRWLQELRGQIPRYENAARNAGLDPNNPLLASSYFDLYTQSPRAAGNFLGKLPELARRGVTPENIADLRVDSYVNPRTGRLDAPGFGNSEQRLRRDQERRTNAVNAVVQREGLDGTTAPSTTRPTQPTADTRSATAPNLEDVAAGRAALRRGMEGSPVEQIQRELVRTGHLTQEQMNTGPGTFGPATEAAVKAFQRSRGLEDDGVVGKDTRAALLEATRPAQPGNGTQRPAAPRIEDVAAGKAELRQGMQGPAVEQLQRELVRRGHLTQAQMDTGPGIYGPATAGAVDAFKRANGIGGSGDAVGKTTWEALRSSNPAQPRPGTGGTDGVPTVPNTSQPSAELAQVRSGQTTLNRGARGPAVEALQNELARAGFLHRQGVDGVFGGGTESALRLFQVRNGMQPSGRLDQGTLQALERTPTFDTRGARQATGYQAGQPFPLTLTPIGTEVEGAGRRTAYLRTDAARAFLEMNRAMQRDIGKSMGINDSFRSNEDQAARRRQYGGAAARPGFSNHQQGLSVDINVRDPQVERWLRENAHRYGFIRGDNVPDDLVNRIGFNAERHHWTYRPEYADDRAPNYRLR